MKKKKALFFGAVFNYLWAFVAAVNFIFYTIKHKFNQIDSVNKNK